MSEPKFTPGPWYSVSKQIRHAEPEPDLPKNTLPNGAVCCCYGAADWPEAQDEAEANIRLISAAPEMYAKLKELADVLRFGGMRCTNRTMAQEIEDILKKARGEV